ncbi:hypothetical protein FD754_015661 [Muntiacus muntjak]|uniref:Taste receptor type 2 n=1 Tax=Muntiacus muntjak TaxID=9888 RepID=A0A5N3VNV4_MUNMU|nr:hypothetical protein FD754_015661 [Muntiacus muntjak]
MSDVIKYVFLIIEISEFITGICGNGFIALVLCADSLKSKNISLLDFIFTCLAISRIGMIFILLLDGIRVVFHPEILDGHRVTEVTFDFLWNLSNSLGTWCAVCLSIFYFLKLSSFSHPFFLWLKWRRNRVVFTIMLGFSLTLFFNLLSIKFNALRVSDCLEIENNLTWKKCMHQTQYYRSQILFHLGSLIPLAVSLILLFLLIFSLWRHTRQMTCHTKGSKDLNTGVLVRARNTLTSFIIFLVVHYLATFMLTWSYFTVENDMTFIAIQTVAFLYPSIHPFILILGNGKLRQISVNLLRQIESCIKGL